MKHDPESAEDSAIIDRYLKMVPGLDPASLARVRSRLASAPRSRRRRWSFTLPLPSKSIPSLVTLAAVILGMVLLVQHNRQRATAGHPAIAANDGTILFSRQNHWYTIAPNGTHLHELLSSTAGCPDFGCAAFSPDGRRIMVAAQSANKKRVATAIINTNGSGYHALPLPDSRLNLGPGTWAPDGTRIALGGWDNSNKARTGIYVVNASDGKGLARLTRSPDGHNDDPLAYSPDGSRLLFYHEETQGSSQLPGFGELFETTATGSGRIQLNPPGTQVTANFGSPASWSPNGRQLTFTAFPNPASSGVSEVFVANANGTHRRRITGWGQWSTSAHWSPDGNWIVFDKVQPVNGGPHRLYLVHPNGTGLKAVTSVNSVGAVCCTVWSPDGTKLLTDSQHDGYLITLNWNGSGVTKVTPLGEKHEIVEYAWGR